VEELPFDNEAECELAVAAYGFLANAFYWADAPVEAEYVPANIAKPLDRLCAHLDRPTILTLISTQFYNYEMTEGTTFN
jgi:hypothetical protein